MVAAGPKRGSIEAGLAQKGCWSDKNSQCAAIDR